MTGGAGNDIYVVDNVGDVITEAFGDGLDTVQSSISISLGAYLEHLTLTGTGLTNGTGNDLANTLIGNTNRNSLSGGAGDDRLDGGLANDTLSGGAGDDTFVFKVGYGKDVVTDFAAGSGLGDVLELSLGTAFDTFAEMIAASAQVGANTVITIDTATSITLQNIQKTALVADDFRFVP